MLLDLELVTLLDLELVQTLLLDLELVTLSAITEIQLTTVRHCPDQCCRVVL